MDLDQQEQKQTQSQRQIPTLRFPGFDEPWEQRKLSEVVKEVKRTDETSDAPVMMITAENGFINQSERYSTNNAGQSLKKYILLEKGELAYNHGASKLRPFGSCFTLISKEKARIPFVYHCFASESENAEFLSLTLNGKPVERQLRRIVSSGARMDGLLNISFEEYTTIPISLPQKAEQDKIADYFPSLNCLITLHQRKLDILKQYKLGVLHRIFDRTIHIHASDQKSYPEWTEQKLSSILKEYSDLNDSCCEQVAVGKYGIRLKESTSDDLSKNKVIYKNTLTIGMGGKQIDIGVLDINASYSVSPAYTTYKIINCNSTFLNYYLMYLNKLLSNKYMITGARQGKSIDKDGFLSYKIKIPCIDEQIRIVELLKEVELAESNQSKLLINLKQLKAALIQKMFI